MLLDMEVDNTSVRNQSQMCMPLNSLHVTAGQLCQLHRHSVVLMSTGFIDNQRLVVKGKLISDLCHKSCNVQVVFEEYSSNTYYQLWNEDGEFLTVPLDADHPMKVTSKTEREETSKEELLCQSVTDTTRERNTLSHELETIR